MSTDRPDWDERILVDKDDISLLIQHKWYVNTFGKQLYAVTSKGLLMHRFLMGAEEGQTIDHINQNGLDNRRENLRFCTTSENLHNRSSIGGSSKYKGVSRVKNKWRSYIWQDYKRIHLGYFEKEEDAARAYDIKAVELFGEFAKLNFGGCCGN